MRVTRFSTDHLSIALALIGAAVAATLGITSTVHAAEKVKVAIPSPGVFFAPYYAAIEKGYYKEEGLEIVIVKAGGGIATPALMSGDLHFSLAASAAVSAILKGAPIRVIMTQADHPTYDLWASSASIRELADFKGKSIAVTSRGDAQEMALRLLLKRVGLGKDSVSFTAVGFGSGKMAAIASGSLAGALLTKRDIANLRGRGTLAEGHMLIEMTKSFATPFGGIATNAKEIRNNASGVKRFLRGSRKGIKFMRAFKTETLRIMRKYNKRASDKALEIDYASVRSIMTKDGTISKKLQRQDAEINAEVMNIPKSEIPPLNQIFDYRLLNEVNRELKASGWKPKR